METKDCLKKLLQAIAGHENKTLTEIFAGLADEYIERPGTDSSIPSG